MKIAFVGKGGSGKTTASTLFAQYQAKYRPTLAIDADINMHMAELLSGHRPEKDTLISESQPSDAIRTYLRGTNERIKDTAHFKKTTPPGKGSNFVDIGNPEDWLLAHFGLRISDKLSLVTVGTYAEEGVVSGCYHGKLSVLENVLSHTLDNGVVVTDMVAGTDAFASTLYSQFDMLVFVVEPTTRSLAVLDQYQRLAKASCVADKLFIIANKIEDEDDHNFVVSHIEPDRLVGCISRSSHLIKVDKGQEALSVDRLSKDDHTVFKQLAALLEIQFSPMQSRLNNLWELHKRYVSQAFVKDYLGDLTTQIDPNFTYPLQNNNSR